MAVHVPAEAVVAVVDALPEGALVAGLAADGRARRVRPGGEGGAATLPRRSEAEPL